MSKILFTLLVLFAVVRGYGQTTIVDFEAIPYTDGAWNGVSEVVTNPDITGLNSSANVCRYTIPASLSWKNCAVIEFSGMIQYKDLDYMEFMVLAPSATQMYVAMENTSVGGVTKAAAYATPVVSDEWQTVRLNFSGVVEPESLTAEYNKITIFFNVNDNVGGEQWHYDNIVVHNKVTPVDPEAPTGLNVSYATDNSFTLSWDADANATNGTNVFIEETATGSGNIYITTLAAGVTSYTYEGTHGSVTVQGNGEYIARIQALPDDNSSAYAQTTVMVSALDKFWSTTATTTDWNTAGNWAKGVVPVASDNVTMATGAANYPNVVGNVVCNNLTIETGALVNVASTGFVKVDGMLTNNGGNSGIVLNYTSTDDAQIQFTGAVDATVIHTVPASTGAGWHPFATGLTSDVQTSNGTAGLTGTGSFYLHKHAEASNVYASASAALMGTMGYLAYSTGGHVLTLKGTISGDGSTFANLTKGGEGFHLLPNTHTTKVNLGSVTIPSADFEQGVWVYNSTTKNFDARALSGVIQPGSSFFVRATKADVSFGMPVGAKLPESSKKSSSEEQSIVVKVWNSEGADVTQVRVVDEALERKDNYDLTKVFAMKENSLQVFTRIGEKSIALNSIPAGFEGVVPFVVRMNDVGTARLDFSKTNWSSDMNTSVWVAGVEHVLDDNYSCTVTGLAGEDVHVELELEKKALSIAHELAVGVDIKSVDRTLLVNLKKVSSATCLVYSLQGKLMKQVLLNTKNSRVDMNVPAGVYVVKVEAGKEEVSERVLIR